MSIKKKVKKRLKNLKKKQIIGILESLFDDYRYTYETFEKLCDRNEIEIKKLQQEKDDLQQQLNKK